MMIELVMTMVMLMMMLLPMLLMLLAGQHCANKAILGSLAAFLSFRFSDADMKHDA